MNINNNYILTISFSRLDFILTLWDQDTAINEIRSDNAARNLILCIDEVLQGKLPSKIAFLSGPGSFTSARIVSATCAGIMTVYKILVVPVLINQAIYEIPGYDGIVILMRCNKHTWHVYDKEWKLMTNQELDMLNINSYTSLDEFTGSMNKPWPTSDLSYGLRQIAAKTEQQLPLDPFYGAI
jgi:tRNA A37 threonylcarbamoyladenosine modification protein TsaB